MVNNRPDFEGGPDQPTSAAMQAPPKAAGLVYRFLPVSGGYQSPEEIETMAGLLETLPRPILAFCRSGAQHPADRRSAAALTAWGLSLKHSAFQALFSPRSPPKSSATPMRIASGRRLICRRPVRNDWPALRGRDLRLHASWRFRVLITSTLTRHRPPQ